MKDNLNKNPEQIRADIRKQQQLIMVWAAYVRDYMIEPLERQKYVKIVADANSIILQLTNELEQLLLLGVGGVAPEDYNGS